LCRLILCWWLRDRLGGIMRDNVFVFDLLLDFSRSILEVIVDAFDELVTSLDLFWWNFTNSLIG